MTDAEAIWHAKTGTSVCRCCGATEGVTYVGNFLCKSCWLSFETTTPPLASPADVQGWLNRRREKLEKR